MEVVQAKAAQFSPVVLYLPGHEHEDKQFFKDEPEMWKIFRRLSRSQKPAHGPNTSAQCGYAPPTINIPGKEGMKCMCYEQLMRIIKERSLIPPPKTYRCPNGESPRLCNDRVFPSWPRMAMLSFRDNAELQLPLGTLTVRWQQKRLLPAYSKAALGNIFSKFGPVEEVRMLGTNSCLVIFRYISSACDAMQARHLGDATNHLHCTWWHKSMANKTVAVKHKGVVIRTNFYLR